MKKLGEGEMEKRIAYEVSVSKLETVYEESQLRQQHCLKREVIFRIDFIYRIAYNDARDRGCVYYQQFF